jgi:hypothetical protein
MDKVKNATLADKSSFAKNRQEDLSFPPCWHLQNWNKVTKSNALNYNFHLETILEHFRMIKLGSVQK